MTVVAFVPCRAGSKRIPRKNLAEIGDASLVLRAVQCAARAITPIDIVVSTDDAEIVSAAKKWDVDIHERPAALATDTAQIEEAIDHWMHEPNQGDSRRVLCVDQDDVIVLLQPTSPFRTPATIRACVDLVRAGCDSAVTVELDVRESGRWRGLYDEKLGRDIGYRTIWNRPIELPRKRSQDAEPRPLQDGCVYAFTVAHFLKTKNRMGGREASVPTHWLEAFEIDTPGDLAFARAIAPDVDALLAMEREHDTPEPLTDEADVEFTKSMKYMRAMLDPVIAMARMMPNGQAAIDKALATILPETERRYREIVFAKKRDAAARARGERLLVRLREELEAYARGQG